jgi:hypothetical protein
MKKIIRYQAEDGKIFETEIACLEYEKILEKIKTIMEPLGDYDVFPSAFGNGDIFLQHDINVVKRINSLLLQAVKDFHKWTDVEYRIGSFIGRYIDDSNSPFKTAYFRLNNIDEKGREWGQLYFKINPNPKAKAYILNPHKLKLGVKSWIQK